jgi:signal transduction histidine kinase
MKLFYKAYFKALLLLLFGLILRGGVNAANDPLNPNPNIEEEVKGKTIDEIFQVANKYSFTNLNVALKYANKAIEIAKQSNNLNDLLDAQRGLAFIYEDNALNTKAIEVHQINLEVAKKLDGMALTTVYNDLAIVSRKVGNFRGAFIYYDLTLEAALRIKDTLMIESSYHGIGMLHKDVGIYDKAIDYFLKSLNICEQSGDVRNIIVSEIDIADSYLKAKEIEKALQHIERAYQMSLKQYKEKPNDDEAPAQLASALNKYGNILVARKDYNAALSRQEEALKIYETFNVKPYIARTLMHIANIYLETNDYVKADIKFKECLKYESQFTIPDLAELHFRMGMYYIQNNNMSLAEHFFVKSLQVANKYDYKETAQKANYQMFLINFSRHNNAKALEYLNFANALSDSLYNAEKTRRTAEIEFKFDNEKRENEIHALKLRENDLKLQQNRIMLISSVVLFIMIVLFLGYTIKMRGRNVQALEQKNSEIQQQYRKLEESNEILSQFAYVAAHDLKEPLRSIGSYIGLIQMRYSKDLPEDAKEYMKFVNNGVKRMYSLLTDLLDFSQVISQQPGSEMVRPNEILMEVQDNLRSAIESKNARIVFNSNLPLVRMNRLHMTQLFQNLIGNALKFTDKPPVVKVEAKEENGNIILTIEDNGIGIKKDYSNKVFVLFQQLNKKGDFEGTGIGLTICKNIVEKYNGKIWFDSEENVGTKFFISIPAQAA